jgi:tRNA uridine 5-carbamoylmethylation protein Kti12
MKKVLKIIHIKEQENQNNLFWSNTNAEHKLSALQEIREQYIELFNKKEEYNESRKGLRRIYRVIKQAQS